MAKAALPEGVLGGLLGLVGMALLSGMDAVGKALGAHLPILQIVVIRYLGAAIILAIYIWVRRRPWPARKNLFPNIQRGGLLGLTLFLFFYAVTHLQLAVATALAMMGPVYIALLGVIFLKERLTVQLTGALFLAIAGACIVIFDSTDGGASLEGDWLAWAAALAAPVTYALVMLLTKLHSVKDRPVTMAFGQFTAAGLIMLPLALPVMVMPTNNLIWLCIAIGGLGAVGGICLIEGIKRLPASVFALIDYTSLLWAALFGMIFFSEQPSLVFWLGGLLIITACVLGVSAQKQAEAIKTSGTPIG